jgi:hypothetical protein
MNDDNIADAIAILDDYKGLAAIAKKEISDLPF